MYSEDWGEALTNKSVPVICVVNLQSGSVGVLQGVPPAVSPGQVRTDRDFFQLLHLTLQDLFVLGLLVCGGQVGIQSHSVSKYKCQRKLI